MWGWLLTVAVAAFVSSGSCAGAGAARLVCYSEGGRTDGFTECTHLVYTGDARGEKLETLLKEYKKSNPRLKIILRVQEQDKDLRSVLKSKYLQGLEVHDAHRTLNRSKVVEEVEKAKTALSANGGGPLFLALPAHPELLAKYYDLHTLVKKIDLMIVQTHALGVVKKMTYHPSRLSGLWDMMNTDSVVDLVVGLGVPASKVVISLPATVRQFHLLNETLSTPGSPTTEDEPKEIDQAELCRLLQKGRWTLERDQDLSAPYAFKDKTWMSFEDSSSVDVKGKYARVRGLAGLSLQDADKDAETSCGPSLKAALAKVLNQQSRAPRAAVLRSLEHEILSAPGHARPLDALQVSPYRITQVVDADGVIHSIREDTRTEFSCSRQGYFVHPRSCARFYRCVKFDQLSPEYTVFEFDCPAGLAFDSRYEVCVWPGSLPDSQACPGSSEIAPVPRTRFICPDHEGYYADPENCRWFFACLDHGQAPLTAYEFRCPFGLGFDAERLKCDWPWLVPACGNIARYEAEAFGFGGAALTGATGFQGQTADAVNVAAHQSLISGASLDNLVGIQNGFLSQTDSLNSNFIASEELAGQAFQDQAIGHALAVDGNVGLVQPAKYSSGSIILDDYRLPTKEETNRKGYGFQQHNYNSYGDASLGNLKESHSSDHHDGDSGAYFHDPSGDYAEPYKHVDAPAVPYVHSDSKYNEKIFDYNDYDRYNTQKYNGNYNHDHSGAYVDSSSTNGAYSGAYNSDYADSYNSNYNSGKYIAGVYREDGHIGNYDGKKSNIQFEQGYSSGNTGYLQNSNAYAGASHTLTNGAVNVGLVGKTTLVDANYNDQFNYNGVAKSFEHAILHEIGTGHVPVIKDHDVSVSHLGTDFNNVDGYSFVTNPTASVIPTTATPFAVTTAIPTSTYGTTYVADSPKTDIKAIFGYTQPVITHVQPSISTIHYTPKVQVTNYNQGVNIQTTNTKSESSGYIYTKPRVKFEDGLTFTTPASVVVSTLKPQGFSQTQQTVHNVDTGRYEYSTPKPITEEPFKKIEAYTTGPLLTYNQPSETYVPQTLSHQIVHNIESNNAYLPPVETGFDYSTPGVVLEHTTQQPIVVSTYQPQGFRHQTLHKVDASQIKTYSDPSYKHEKPLSGYEYKKPEIKFEESFGTVEHYSTPSPAVPTHIPQTFSHQTVHKTESFNYVPVSPTPAPTVELSYHHPAVTVYQNPILQHVQNVTPVPFVESSPQTFSLKTIHNIESNEYLPPVKQSGYTYEKPKTVFEHTTIQPIVTTTYQPQIFSHQTVHKVESGKVDAGYHYEPVLNIDTEYKHQKPIVTTTYNSQINSQNTIHQVDTSKIHVSSDSKSDYSREQPLSGYQYEYPNIRLEENLGPVIHYTTPTPVTSAYKPLSLSHHTYHNTQTQNIIPVTTSVPKVEVYNRPEITVHQNPILKFTENVTPTPVYQQNQINRVNQLQYGIHQNLAINGYTYNEPEIQRDIEISNVGNSYSEANLVSHQYKSEDLGKKVVFVSSTPSNLIYEDHYAEYEPSKFKAADYTPPEKIHTVSTVAPQVIHESSFSIQNQFKFKPAIYSHDTSSLSEVSFSNSHEQPKPTETVHFASVPEIQVEYKAEEYLPPPDTPYNKTTYKPHVFSSTTREYLPPIPQTFTSENLPPQPEYKTPEYLPPQVDNTYIPPSTTFRPIVKFTTPLPTTYKAPDYLPPFQEIAGVATFESYGFKNNVQSNVNFNSFPEYTVSTTAAPLPKQNVLFETSNLLGFGTVGPNAGLVSPVASTVGTLISSTYLPPDISSSTYLPPIASSRRPKPKSTTQAPAYLPPITTTYKAPEYLPPVETTTTFKAAEYLPPVKSDNFHNFGLKSIENPQLAYNPYNRQTSVPRVLPMNRKQNIVIQTAKANQNAYGTVRSDAGLVSEAIYTTASPIVTTSGAYNVNPKIASSTYAPVKQELVEVSPVPVRRTKPKVAVVTKINDFNPLLVRKLGAVCSCQSPIVILRGKRPHIQAQPDYEDYNIDYEDGRGDMGDDKWALKSERLEEIKTVTTSPVFRTTFNPIIVPDDSFYQDIQESNIEIAPKSEESYTKDFASSTSGYSTPQKTVKIRPRVKAVTVAPTYKTIVLNQEVAPEVVVKATTSRNRDELPDCQRAGLFRHPKQCNKFYACRWDCNKQKFTVHTFNCPVQLSFDPSIGACNWPSQGPACQGDTLLTNAL